MTEDKKDILISETMKLITDSAIRTDKINSRLVKIITVMAICLVVQACVIVGLKDGFYFLSDYQYPEAEQLVNQTAGGKYQEVTQTIK
jgi:hypothetical protein